MLVITIPKPLREKLGDKASDSLVELLNKVYQTTREDIVEVSLDKFEKKLVSETSQLDKKITGEILRLEQRLIEEVTRLEQKIAETEAKLDKRITEEVTRLEQKIAETEAKLDKRITEEVARLEQKITDEVSKLRVEMASYHARLIRWMFIFWIGQIGALIGILLAFFK